LWLNNLATGVCAYEGPASSLALAQEAVALASSRGIVETALEARATCIEFMYATGDWDGLLELAKWLREHIWTTTATSLYEMDAVVADVLVGRGRLAEAESHLDGLVDAARRNDEIQHMITGFSVGARAAVARGDVATAQSLMAELARAPELRRSYNFPAYLPELVRNAIASRDLDRGHTLLEGFEVVAPMHAYARRAAEAQLAEARAEIVNAAKGYEEVAVAWRDFGFVPEQAFALLGHGRCLVALGDTAADQPLRDARAIFERLGARPSVEDCDALIARAMKLSS